jgi:hypothetical protein
MVFSVSLRRIALFISLWLPILGAASQTVNPAPPPANVRTHAEPVPGDKSPVGPFLQHPSRKTAEMAFLEAASKPPPPRTGPPKVVLVVVDHVGLQDVQAAFAPRIQQFFRENAVGLMNFASAGGRSADGSYASLSAGMHAAAVAEAGLFRNASEPFEEGTARAAFLRRTGMRVGPQTLLNLGIAPLLKINEDKDTLATVGALGRMASSLGPTVAIGNSDSPDPAKPSVRFAPLLAMRPSGIVDRGDISRGLLRPDPNAPFGVATDPQKLVDAYRHYSPGASLVVVDLGETTRAEEYGKLIARSLRKKHRLRALARADELFNRLLQQIDLKSTRVVLLTPCPPLSDEGAYDELAPVAMTGLGVGLLTSATTQGDGLIANIDLAPTLESILSNPVKSSPRSQAGKTKSLNPEDRPMTTGSPMTAVPYLAPLSYLATLDRAVTAQRRAASGAFLPTFAALEVLFAALGLIFAWRQTQGIKGNANRILGRFCLCAAVYLPLSLVVAGGQLPSDLGYLAAIAGLAWLAFSALTLLLGKRAVPTALLACGLAILADLLTGGLGLRLSPISDFPIVGVRFHGLGNEYLGITLGAILMGMSGLSDTMPTLTGTRSGRALLWVLALGSILIIGAPAYGDDAGGLIAALFGFGAFGLLLYHLPLNVRNLLGLLVLAITSAWLMAGLDSATVGPTHYGRSLLLAEQQGPAYLLDIIERKISLNLRFMTDFRAWIAYGGIAVLCILAYQNDRGRLRQALSMRPGLANGLKAAVVGSIAAWAFNDTGILPALIILATALIALLYALLEQTESIPTSLIQIELPP